MLIQNFFFSCMVFSFFLMAVSFFFSFFYLLKNAFSRKTLVKKKENIIRSSTACKQPLHNHRFQLLEAFPQLPPLADRIKKKWLYSQAAIADTLSWDTSCNTHNPIYLSIYLSIYRLFASITIIDDSCKLENGQRSIYK